MAGDVVRGLRALGHCVTKHRYGAMGHANSVLLLGERFYGYADPREGGAACGPKRCR
jgi:gamma-glutamyltranspeptidase